MEFTETGYKYDLESLADVAINQLNIYYGISPAPNRRTDAYAARYKSYNDKGKVDFYYINFDPSMTIVLGDPIEMTINTIQE